MVNFVVLARVVKPHGIRGDVVIRIFCSEPLEQYLPLMDLQGESYSIRALRPTGQGTAIAHIPGVETRDQAEALRGRDLGVRREHLPPIEKGTFYIHDLLGLTVVDTVTGKSYGKLTYIHDFGAGAVLEVKTVQGKLLHASFQSVQEIDLDQKLLKIEGCFLI